MVSKKVKRAPRRKESAVNYEEAAQELAAAQAASNALPSAPVLSDEELIARHHQPVLAELRQEIEEQFIRDRKLIDKRLAAAEKRMAQARPHEGQLMRTA